MNMSFVDVEQWGILEQMLKEFPALRNPETHSCSELLEAVQNFFKDDTQATRGAVYMAVTRHHKDSAGLRIGQNRLEFTMPETRDVLSLCASENGGVSIRLPH
jgi:hypothetical protein